MQIIVGFWWLVLFHLFCRNQCLSVYLSFCFYSVSKTTSVNLYSKHGPRLNINKGSCEISVCFIVSSWGSLHTGLCFLEQKYCFIMSQSVSCMSCKPLGWSEPRANRVKGWLSGSSQRLDGCLLSSAQQTWLKWRNGRKAESSPSS